jgi:DNA-binding winged helix-turn-helix (wHTH) protein
LPPTAYRFGPFVVDRAAYRLLEDGRPLDLTPQLLDLLPHLLDRTGELVTKEALLLRGVRLLAAGAAEAVVS